MPVGKWIQGIDRHGTTGRESDSVHSSPQCKTLKVVEVICGPPSTAHREFKVYRAPPLVQHIPHKVRRDLK